MSDTVITGADVRSVLSAGDALAAGDTVVLMDPSSPVAVVFTLRRIGMATTVHDAIGREVALFDDVEEALVDGLARVRGTAEEARAALHLGL